MAHHDTSPVAATPVAPLVNITKIKVVRLQSSAAAAGKASKPFPFFNLPPELRNEVYHWIWAGKRPFRIVDPSIYDYDVPCNPMNYFHVFYDLKYDAKHINTTHAPRYNDPEPPSPCWFILANRQMFNEAIEAFNRKATWRAIQKYSPRRHGLAVLIYELSPTSPLQPMAAQTLNIRNLALCKPCILQTETTDSKIVFDKIIFDGYATLDLRQSLVIPSSFVITPQLRILDLGIDVDDRTYNCSYLRHLPWARTRISDFRWADQPADVEIDLSALQALSLPSLRKIIIRFEGRNAEEFQEQYGDRVKVELKNVGRVMMQVSLEDEDNVAVRAERLLTGGRGMEIPWGEWEYTLERKG